MSKTIIQEAPRTPVALQVRAGTPGGATLVMTQGESVGYPCTIDSTCLTMEMLCGGEFMCYMSFMNDYQAPDRTIL